MLVGVELISRLWASSRLLDIVQKSFGEGGCPPAEVFRVAGISIFVTASDDIYGWLSRQNDALIRVGSGR